MSQNVECANCRMDLGIPQDDYSGNGYCGHCENERHVCPVPESAASKVLRDAIQRIKFHAFEWRMKGSGPDSLALLGELVESFEEAIPREGQQPFTVVMDWESDFWESRADDVREYGQDDPVTFHVWAANASDASDEAAAKAAEMFKEAAEYLGHMAVLHGHAPLVSGC
ncbi:hypothetical protein [Streptomyces sp. NPDC059874]|uniref:hypothetical protein n=1 Tax=Streptomyces sp. NPDC059874 TaxID=3346983 RepID=UPI00365B3CB7